MMEYAVHMIRNASPECILILGHSSFHFQKNNQFSQSEIEICIENCECPYNLSYQLLKVFSQIYKNKILFIVKNSERISDEISYLDLLVLYL